jgi:hypothetical protein
MRSQSLVLWLATLVVSSAQQVAFQGTQDVYYSEQGTSPSNDQTGADHSS